MLGTCTFILLVSDLFFLKHLRREKEKSPSVFIAKTIPKKGSVDGYTQGISQAGWCRLGPSLSWVPQFSYVLNRTSRESEIRFVVAWRHHVLWSEFISEAWRRPYLSSGPVQPAGGQLSTGGQGTGLLGTLACTKRLRFQTFWGQGLFQIMKNLMSHLLRQTCTRVYVHKHMIASISRRSETMASENLG